ncbi:sugar transferase [Jannaschia sp. R86511]|uniref:sugar transferase n=1 Tax=Jannaschia sp. R86511 TaxID=3093853 RepID=UPI0036D3D21A
MSVVQHQPEGTRSAARGRTVEPLPRPQAPARADEPLATRRTRPGLVRATARRRSAVLLGGGDLTAMSLPMLVLPDARLWVLLSTVLTVVLFAGSALYRPRLQWSLLDDVPAMAGARLTAVAVAGVLLVVVQRANLVDFLVVVGWGTLLLLLSRAVTYGVIRHARLAGVVQHRCLVVGGGVVAGELVGLLSRHAELGLLPVGYVDEGRHAEVDVQGVGHLGRVADLEAVVAEQDVTVLLVTFGHTRDQQVAAALRAPGASSCTLFVVPRLYEVMSVKGVKDHVGAIPVIRVRRPSRRGFAPAAKRGFDVVSSLLALLVLAPVLLACAVAVRTTGPGVLFRQERVGQDGQLFELLKFRSMRPTAPGDAGSWSAHGDPRVTRVGAFLRRTSLDELPQLWNILRGQMTVVGPRPERPVFAEQFSREFPPYADRHRVPVGLTGMAQVSGLRGGDTSISLRARYDNYYIENWSLWGDVKVILRTVSEVVRAKGS